MKCDRTEFASQVLGGCDPPVTKPVAQQVGTSWYEIVYRDGDGPHLLVTVSGSNDEARLTQRFGQPIEDPVDGVDRLLAYIALWAGPVATIGGLIIIGTIGWVLLDRRPHSIAEERTETASR